MIFSMMVDKTSQSSQQAGRYRFLLVIARLAQSTQNSKFVISLHYLKKRSER